MIDKIISKILLNVEKPSRYTGGELFAIVKKNPIARIALSYPDLYEVGMANHGIKILYEIANSIEGVACERVFSVSPDMSELLKKESIPLWTLETNTPLHACDLIAFNLSHDLLCTNMLQILDLGCVPLRAALRDNTHPIIIAGGECVSNPAPIAPFIDLFFIGEGEDGFREIAEVICKPVWKGYSRAQRIEKLAQIEGIYNHQSGKQTKKRIYRGKPADPMHPVIPSMRITQDRALLEVMRGCANLCKFCHAGYYNLPCRHYDFDSVANRARELIKNTGYDEITFLSLSISDYRSIIPLLNNVLPGFNEQGVSVSLPSLRVDTRTLPLIEVTSDVRKSSLTFAVEAASDEMRSYIHKKLSVDELIEITERVFSGKWDTVKLYFMIGLPGFRDQDEAGAIIDLLFSIDDIGRKRKKINVTISPFIPKPHTPFERVEMADEEYLRTTVERIKRAVPRRIAIKNHSIDSSMIEGLISRGDDKVAETIEQAYRSGAILDSWDEHVRYDIWRAAISKTIGDTAKYYAERSKDELLPWKVIETGYEKLLEVMAPRCTDDKKNDNPYVEKLDHTAISDGFNRFTKRYEVKGRYRIIFEKKGRAKYISHLDFIECVKRGFRIMNAPVAFSQGFNKHERIAAGYPLPLGIESQSEIIDIETFAEMQFDTSSSQSEIFPEGIRIRSIRLLDTKKSVMSETEVLHYEMHCDNDLKAQIDSAITEGKSLERKRKDGTIEQIAIKDAVIEIIPCDNGIGLLLPATGGIRVDSLIKQVTGDNESLAKCSVMKVGQLCRIEGSLVILQ